MITEINIQKFKTKTDIAYIFSSLYEILTTPHDVCMIKNLLDNGKHLFVFELFSI